MAVASSGVPNSGSLVPQYDDMMSSTKQLEKDRSTATGNMHKNSVKFGCVVFELCEFTDRQSDIFITVLCTFRAGEVIMALYQFCVIKKHLKGHL